MQLLFRWCVGLVNININFILLILCYITYSQVFVIFLSKQGVLLFQESSWRSELNNYKCS